MQPKNFTDEPKTGTAIWAALDLVSLFPSLSFHRHSEGTLTLLGSVTSEQRGGLEWTLPHLKTLLEKTGLRLPQVTRWLLPEGPGSFTGLRIGAATVKGLLVVNPCPVTVISSLEARVLSHPQDAVAVYRVGQDQFAAGFYSDKKWQAVVVAEKEIPALAAGRPILVDGYTARLATLALPHSVMCELSASQLAPALLKSQTAKTLTTPEEWMAFQPSYWGDTRFGAPPTI